MQPVRMHFASEKVTAVCLLVVQQIWAAAHLLLDVIQLSHQHLSWEPPHTLSCS